MMATDDIPRVKLRIHILDGVPTDRYFYVGPDDSEDNNDHIA
jgi:hypothetical protein